MAKGKLKDNVVSSLPSTLRMELFAPGMSVLHRVGLGGLACTLRALERDTADGNIDADDLPGGPWAKEPKGGLRPPWTIEQHAVTLDFGKPEGAGEYLKNLFSYAFAVNKSGLILLPGQYRQGIPPRDEVLAELQLGLTLTFLQHGKVRGLEKTETILSYDPEQTGVPSMNITFKRCEWYKHQQGHADLVDKKGQLRSTTIEIIGPLSPGSVVRHNAFSADTKLEDMPVRVLPLYFALVGALALSVNRGVGILIVPEVDDLLSFIRARPLMTPTRIGECRVTSAGDAALQAQIRVAGAEKAARLHAPACYAMTLRPTTWASQQKSRVATMQIPVGDDLRLKKFMIAMAELPPRIAKTDNKSKTKTAKTEYFWADSVIRPLIADNLALGHPWYEGFTRLMTRSETNDKLNFERKGIMTMAEKIGCDSTAETTIVLAVQEAMRRRYAQIADENKTNPVAKKNRWQGEYDRWRLAFAGAKTPDQLRNSLCDLWSRGGRNTPLQENWQSILPLLSGNGWQLVRDLALLALASYQGRSNDNNEADASDNSKEQ